MTACPYCTLGDCNCYKAGRRRGLEEAAEAVLSIFCGLTPAQVEAATACHAEILALLKEPRAPEA